MDGTQHETGRVHPVDHAGNGGDTLLLSYESLLHACYSTSVCALRAGKHTPRLEKARDGGTVQVQLSWHRGGAHTRKILWRSSQGEVKSGTRALYLDPDGLVGWVVAGRPYPDLRMLPGDGPARVVCDQIS